MTLRCLNLLLTALAILGCNAGIDSGNGDLGAPPIGGGETSDFGGDVCEHGQVGCSGECSGTPLAISSADAVARGFDVAADRAVFERSFEAPVIWANPECSEHPESCLTSQITLTNELESIQLVKYRPNPGVDAARCPGNLTYRTLVGVTTRDGRLKGSFYARLNAQATAEGPFFQVKAYPDLRNFKGSLPIAIDLARPHWSVISASLSFSADGAVGILQPVAKYVDDRDAEPLIIPVAETAIWPRWVTADSTDTLGKAALTLDAYTGSTPEVTYEVAVRVQVEGNEEPALEVNVDGKSVSLGAVSSGSAVTVGRLKAGTRVAAHVRSSSNTTVGTSLTILAEGCVQASEFCAETQCTAHAEFTVAPPQFCVRSY